MSTLSITVDIEDWYHIPSVTGSPFAVCKDGNEFFDGWNGRYDYLTEPTKRVLDMLDEFDIKATFFVVADVVGHYQGLVESIVSVNSLYNKTDSSLKGVSSYPYYPKKNGLDLGVGEEKERDFIEFPWPYWNVFGFNFKIPTAGGPMLRFLGAHVILKGLKQSTKRGHTVFYFHPIDISEEKFPAVGKGRPLYWIVKGKLVEKRIRYILKNLKDVNKVCMKDASLGATIGRSVKEEGDKA